MKRLLFYICLIFCLQAFNGLTYAFEEINPDTQNEFAQYMYDIKEKLSKNWLAPDFIEDGHLTVIFKLDNEGYVTYAKITEPSGNIFYDESAIYALQKSEPFGKFPQNTNKANITIKYSFDTSVTKTSCIKEYIENADKYSKLNDFNSALKYINLAIAESKNDEKYYFLYKYKADLEEHLGMKKEVNEDLTNYKKLKTINDTKRVHYVKHFAEIENTPFAYFYLAYCFEQIEDYKQAIEAIDKAISMTELNNQYKRYRKELITKYK